MTKSGCKCRSALLAALFFALCPAAWAQKPYFDGTQSLYDRAPAGEVAALPKYCWGKYIPKFKGPKYNIQRSTCGEWANHFCQGILQFNRSQHPMATKAERTSYLHQAIGNIEYTIRGIQKFPACPIRKHAHLLHRRALALRNSGANVTTLK